MDIVGLEGLSEADLASELDRGGKFVIYSYAISVIVMTFKRPSDIHFIKGGESRFGRGVKYSGLSFVAGWWGFPWGPIYTIGAIVGNSLGGKDVTKEIRASIYQTAQRSAAKKRLIEQARSKEPSGT